MTTRDRSVLGVVALLALLAGFWFLLLAPQRKEAASLDAQQAAAEQRRDAALGLVSQGEAARADYGKAQAALARLGKAVPGDDDTASFLFQMESAARQAGIDFRALKLEGAGSTTAAGSGAAPTGTSTLPPGAVPGPNGLTQLPFKLTFEGDYTQLRRFLGLVGSFTKLGSDGVTVSGRLLTVDGVGLTISEAGFPQLKAEIVTSAYLAPDDEDPLAPGATPAGAPAPGAAAPDATAGQQAGTAPPLAAIGG